MSTLQAAVESLRVDNDMILKSRVTESEARFAEPAEDTVMASLFPTSETPASPPLDHAKRSKGREEDEARAWKK